MTGVRIVAFVVASWAVASAEPRKLDDAAKERAIAHFRQGDEFFKRSQWDNAIEEYQAAYDITGEPLMLFDIAVAHDKAGRVEPAYVGYESYLRQVSLGDAADDARAAKARLQPEMDKIRAARAVQEQAAAAARAKAEREAAERAEVARREALREAAEQRAVDHDRRGRRLTVYAGAIAGASVLGFVLAGKYGLEARSIADEITNNEGGWTEAKLAREADGRAANTTAIVLMSAGGALAVTSGVVYLLARRSHHRAERIRIEIAPAGVAIAGRF